MMFVVKESTKEFAVVFFMVAELGKRITMMQARDNFIFDVKCWQHLSTPEVYLLWIK
jgi:hypothetical protein